MTRFQALTNHVLEVELERLRGLLGLEPSQKAELLREVTALASWVVLQAEQGRSIEARRGQHVERLSHPVLARIQAEHQPVAGQPLTLSDEEVVQLAQALGRPFEPTTALRKALENLADPGRSPPRIRWKKRS